MTARLAIAALSLFLLRAAAQGPPPGPPGGHPDGGPHSPYDMGPGRGPRQRPSDSNSIWWNNRALVERLGLTDAQRKHIDQIVQQSRLRLIDLRAALAKQELILDPLLAEDHPQENQVLPQIDRVANARADLERANARMLFEIRLVLTPEQWKELQSQPQRSR
jgi:Spy/CpxP family protein refolding chaperone